MLQKIQPKLVEFLKTIKFILNSIIPNQRQPTIQNSFSVFLPLYITMYLCLKTKHHGKDKIQSPS